MKNTLNFTEGKIYRPLLNFTMPILFAMFLQVMYGTIDLLIVGQFGNATDVSAVSTGSQVMYTLTAFILGLAMGITILLSQKIGQKNYHDAGNVIGSGIYLFAILSVIITILMFFNAVPLSKLMQTPVESFDKTVIYVQICSAGVVFIIAYNVLGSIFRGIGDSKTPLITVAIACVVNIIGDLLFVGVFHMEAGGAALATVLAQAVSFILSVIIIMKKGIPFSFSKKNVRFHKKITLETIRLGLPVALQNGLVSVSFLVIIAIVNSLGVIPSAGVGIAERLVIFIMLVPSSFMQSLSVFVAQNIGARRFDRAKKTLVYAIATSFCFSIIMFYVSFFHGDILSGIFTKDTAIIAASQSYMKAYAIDCLLTAFKFCLIGFFNGCGKTTFVMAQGVFGAFAVRIPVSYFMSKLQPVSLFRVGLATPISSLIEIALCIVYFIVLNNQQKEHGHLEEVII